MSHFINTCRAGKKCNDNFSQKCGKMWNDDFSQQKVMVEEVFAYGFE